MEALRAAGRAVLRSPSLARHRLAVPRLRREPAAEASPSSSSSSSWSGPACSPGSGSSSSSLPSPPASSGGGGGGGGSGSGAPSPSSSSSRGRPWSELREPLLVSEGSSSASASSSSAAAAAAGFALKYLGMTLVGEPRGEEMAAAAVRRILATARAGPRPRKLRKVVLGVSPRGLSLQDAETRESIDTVSIYRISYCTTDKLQNKVFAYVAQNPRSGALECHAFLSPKKKVAQAVTLTVAQAFQVALDLWEAAQAGSREEKEEEEHEEKRAPQRPLCPSEGAFQPAPPSLCSPPFKADFEEEEEGGDLSNNLASCVEEGGCPAGGGALPSAVPRPHGSSRGWPGAAVPPAAACLQGPSSETAPN